MGRRAGGESMNAKLKHMPPSPSLEVIRYCAIVCWRLNVETITFGCVGRAWHTERVTGHSKGDPPAAMHNTATDMAG
jgi:hypothetical protein